MEQAGADALELNLSSFQQIFKQSGSDVEKSYIRYMYKPLNQY